MKKNANARLLLVLLMSISFFACNDKAKKDEAVTKVEEKTDGSANMPGYDAAMDPLKVTGYPARVLADSLGMKAYEFLANPGDSIPMHSHPDHLIYVLESGTAEIKGQDGSSQVVDFKKDACMISGPQAHSAKNTGTTPIKLLIVQLYRPRN